MISTEVPGGKNPTYAAISRKIIVCAPQLLA